MRRRRFRFLVFASASTATALLSVMRKIYIPPRGMSSLFGAFVEFSPARDDARILPAIRCIGASHASVVSEQRLRQAAGAVKVVREYCDAVTDVGFDVEE